MLVSESDNVKESIAIYISEEAQVLVHYPDSSMVPKSPITSLGPHPLYSVTPKHLLLFI